MQAEKFQTGTHTTPQRQSVIQGRTQARVMQQARRAGKILFKTLGYAVAFFVPPLVVGYAIMLQAQATLTAPPPTAYVNPELPRPAHDPGKPTVAILASNAGTEITDFLAPFEVFAATGAFNVYAVAPERELVPFLWGGVDLMPHYSFAELDQLLAGKPDVIVVPFIKNPEDPEMVAWIRAHAGENTVVISICGGAHTLAHTGLVDGGVVTSHANYLPLLAKRYPHLQLARGVRYTDNGNTITSAGITAGIDASLYAVQKLLGRETALATARQLRYPHTQFLDDPAYELPRATGALLATSANAGFRWPKDVYGVLLFDGVGEIDLTALLDSYGRTFTATTLTVAPARQAIATRHGLYLVPRADFATAPRFARLLVPGDPAAPTGEAAAWAQEQGIAAPQYLFPDEIEAGNSGPFAFDMTLMDLARHSSTTEARSSATTLEYPAAHLTLAARAWSPLPVAFALAIGALSLGGVAWLERQWLKRRPELSV